MSRATRAPRLSGKGPRRRASEPASKDRVALTLPARLVEALGVAPGDLEGQVSEALAVDLFRRGEVTAGFAAQLLGMSRWGFLDVLARHNVPYFELDDADLEAEAAAIREWEREDSGE